MNKRLFSIILLIQLLLVSLCGCNNEPQKTNRQVVLDNTVSIKALLPADSDISELYKNGMTFANELANSINIGESVDIEFETIRYDSSTDIVALAQSLVDNGASAIIYSGNDYNSFKVFTSFVDTSEVPVISLSPYNYEADNFFSLTLNPKFISSCVATYVMENGYINPLVIFESTNDYYVDFSDTIKSTFLSYLGSEPAVIYKSSGDIDAFESSLAGHDFIFIAASASSAKDDIEALRNIGFSGKIMLSEAMDKSLLSEDVFAGSSVISKFEVDSSNNVSTVFCSMYSEAKGIGDDEIQPAVAYGYDAYMLAYEGLKSFEADNNLLFNDNTTASNNLNSSEIMLTDLTDAINNINYLGVTDTIIFTQGQTSPTYIYVDNVSSSGVSLEKKYTFSS